MNHYFTINYSFLLPEKSFVLYKSNNFPYQYFKHISSFHPFLAVKYTKYYITKSLTIVIKTILLVNNF